MIEKEKPFENLVNKIKESAEKMKAELNDFQEKFIDKATSSIESSSGSLGIAGIPGHRRGFEIIADAHRKFPSATIKFPLRSTPYSAGYDFFSNEDYELKPMERHVFWTDIKAFMQHGEVLKVYIRSSLGFKKGLQIANGTGIIDCDYFSNPNNDGNIGFCIINLSNENVKISKGEKIAQGIFEHFLEAESGFQISEEERKGGIGSTNARE